jgi:hypothetical protein
MGEANRSGAEDLPPASPRPVVWTWFVVYCAFMAVMYLLIAVACILFLVFGRSFHLEPGDMVGLLFVCGINLFVGLSLGGLFGAAPFLPPKPWSWIYGIVCIGIGLSSPCCMPASIPLLIYWIKPETRRYFGRSDA